MARWALPAPGTARPARSSSALEGNEPRDRRSGRREGQGRGDQLHRHAAAGGHAHTIQFEHTADIVLSLRAMDFHSNGMVFLAFDGDGAELSRRVYYSVGGGFVVDEEGGGRRP
mgnify:CR=1 FL=1